MELSDFEKDVIDRLGRIETMLGSDYKAIHGNGKPGLLDRVSLIEHQISVLKEKSKWYKDWAGWLIATALAVAQVWKMQIQ